MQRIGLRRFRERPWTWLLATAVLLTSGCDSGSVPVGPSGTLFTITANPLTISLNGTSIVEVVARDPSGVPVRTGTEVRFTTSLGRIDELARTDGDGVARATLEATGTSGSAVVTATSGVSSASVTVSVESRPTADFGCDGRDFTVIFDDRSTGDPTGWRWDFGDGGASSEREPTYTYTDAGTYLVELEVTNAGGADSARKFAAVPGTGDVCSSSASSPPIADFTCNASERTVLFTDASSGEPISWHWDFGDGGTSSDKDPLHTYGADGTFVVTLTVRNARGEDSVSRFAMVPGTGEVCS